MRYGEKKCRHFLARPDVHLRALEQGRAMSTHTSFLAGIKGEKCSLEVLELRDFVRPTRLPQKGYSVYPARNWPLPEAGIGEGTTLPICTGSLGRRLEQKLAIMENRRTKRRRKGNASPATVPCIGYRWAPHAPGG